MNTDSMNPTNPHDSSDSSHRIPADAKQRDAALYGLKLGLDNGQLSAPEHEHRTAVVRNATYVDELTQVVSDLTFNDSLPAATDPNILSALALALAAQAHHAQPMAMPTPAAPLPTTTETAETTTNSTNLTNPVPPTAPAPAAEPYYASGVRNTSSFYIFGGVNKEDPWTCGPKHTIVGVSGGARVDFTAATLSTPVTEVKIMAGLGGIRVMVPETYRINTSVAALIAGIKIEDEPGVTIPLADVPIGAPLLDFRGFVLLAGLNIRRVPV